MAGSAASAAAVVVCVTMLSHTSSGPSITNDQLKPGGIENLQQQIILNQVDTKQVARDAMDYVIADQRGDQDKKRATLEKLGLYAVDDITKPLQQGIQEGKIDPKKIIGPACDYITADRSDNKDAAAAALDKLNALAIIARHGSTTNAIVQAVKDAKQQTK